jgi:glycosyltransferase involved in cell wall biosynthesis
MNVLGFCEGARDDAGGVGLVGVPGIHLALAGRGHRDALLVAGRPMPSAVPLLKKSLGEIFDSPNETATGVVSVPAYGRWYFSPGLYRTAAPWAGRADFITMHSLFSYPVAIGYMLAQRHNKPYGVWPHGVFAPVQRRVSPFKKAAYDWLLARRILESASILFYSAEGEREEARVLGLKAPSLIIPHGIDVAQFDRLPAAGAFRSKYLGGHRGPLILYLGRLNTKKGLDLLVAAMACVLRDIPDAKLAIAGGGHPPEFVDEVCRWIAAAGVGDACVMTGVLDENDKRAALADCDVFVLPSAAENFGFSLFEAMACRRAVVCSDTINYAHEVRRRGAGLAVPRTPDAMSHAIVTLLREENRRRAMGNNGWALASDYSWESCGRRVETAIRSVLMHEPFPTSLQPA